MFLKNKNVAFFVIPLKFFRLKCFQKKDVDDPYGGSIAYSFQLHFVDVLNFPRLFVCQRLHWCLRQQFVLTRFKRSQWWPGHRFWASYRVATGVSGLVKWTFEPRALKPRPARTGSLMKKLLYCRVIDLFCTSWLGWDWQVIDLLSLLIFYQSSRPWWLFSWCFSCKCCKGTVLASAWQEDWCRLLTVEC